MLCKICPTCKHKNNQDELICKSCLTPIDSVDIVDCEEVKKQKDYVEFVFDRYTIKLYDGDIVGREHKAQEFLKDKLTISREHLEVKKEEDKFFIVDKNSTNGVYLNGKKIESNKKIQIKSGDELSLSKQLKCKVKI